MITGVGECEDVPCGKIFSATGCSPLLNKRISHRGVRMLHLSSQKLGTSSQSSPVRVGKWMSTTDVNDRCSSQYEITAFNKNQDHVYTRKQYDYDK